MASVEAAEGNYLRYHHIQLYVDSIASLEHYKALEKDANAFSKAYEQAGSPGVEKGREILAKTIGEKKMKDPSNYSSSNQDVIEQLITGAGWRIIASFSGNGTTSVLMCSVDPAGVKFVISAKAAGNGQKAEAKDTPKYDHFLPSHIDRFYKSHENKQGVAVLGFEAYGGKGGGVARIMEKYKALHPSLIVHGDGKLKSYPSADGKGKCEIGEAFAYYAADGKADQGTVIRFVESQASGGDAALLPGFKSCPAEFPAQGYASYCDHWVSNVFNRKQFLKTLEDTLGFTPKVDFNAGVVAAGEAIIESTVTGNTSRILENKDQALKSHQQVYLPINNALSEVGHVHLFLDQLGQGIQHIASRVSDVVSFVSLVNLRREITGQGFSFLRIPRSYYGRLTDGDLTKTGASDNLAQKCYEALREEKLVTATGIVDLDVTEESVSTAVSKRLPSGLKEEFLKNKAAICETVLRARYVNLYKLLRGHLSAETYMRIVRNKILVDIQGNDILFQIFTSSIVQKTKGDEAPFLEFIQRVCSEKKGNDGKTVPIRPGCGGFGIRNFLTLFLSIEVSKAMDHLEAALEEKNSHAAQIAERQVKTLTAQLDESNPVLTAISDAMTAESDALAAAAAAGKGTEEHSRLEKVAEEWRAKKLEGNNALQTISDRYKALMKKIREEKAVVSG